MEREPNFDHVLETFDDWSLLPEGLPVDGMLVGLDSAIAEVTRALDDRAPFLIVGGAGSGKTSVARVAVHSGPHLLFSASLVGLMANTLFAGWWQTKLGAIQRSAAELQTPDRNVALYVTDFVNLFRESRGDRGRLVADDLLSAHRSGDLLVCGETTPELLPVVIRDARWTRELRIIRIPALNDDSLRVVLRNRAFALGTAAALRVPSQWKQGRPGATDGEAALDEAVDLARRFLHGGEPAAPLALIEDAIGAGHLDVEAIQEMAARRTGVARRMVCDAPPMDVAALSEELRQRVLGQPEAVAAAAHAIATIKAGMSDRRRPLWVACFAGPSGTGKTELAKAIAETILGDDVELARFDMSEYIGQESAASLAAAVVQRTSGRPLTVVLFDEIEKATFNSLDVLLQIMSDGRCTASDGQVTSLRQSIVLLTTNLGFSTPTAARRPAGFTGGRPVADAAAEARVRTAMEERLRPEFIGRIDSTVVFKPLGPETLREIAERELQRALSREGLRRRNVAVTYDECVLRALADAAADERYGARPVVAAIRRLVVGPLAALIASDPRARGIGVQLRVEGGTISLATADVASSLRIGRRRRGF